MYACTCTHTHRHTHTHAQTQGLAVVLVVMVRCEVKAQNDKGENRTDAKHDCRGSPGVGLFGGLLGAKVVPAVVATAHLDRWGGAGGGAERQWYGIHNDRKDPLFPNGALQFVPYCTCRYFRRHQKFSADAIETCHTHFCAVLHNTPHVSKTKRATYTI